MKTVISVLLLSLVCLINPTKQARDPTCGDVGKNLDTLALTVVIFRHGDRTPYKTYPKDIYQEDAWAKWGGFGQLTQEGMQQHYVFGQWFRNCYNGFLKDLYNPKDLFIRSTDYDRTLQSVEAHLAGAYPPHDWQQWGTDDVSKQWMPVPIHTIPRPDDYSMIPELPCPPYDALILDVWANNPRIKKIQKENQALLDFLGKHAGLGLPGDLNEISQNMCDPVSTEIRHNMALPDWINSTIVDKLDLWKDIWLIVRFSNDEMVRYGAGELVNHMSELLLNKTKGLIPQKHIIYSGHDTTISAMLAAFGDFDRMGPQSRPPFRASLITELHYDGKEEKYFVKAFYRNNTEEEPIPLRIRNCGNVKADERCYLEDYVKAMQPIIMKNKREVCWGKKSHTDLDTNSIIAIAVTTSLVAILVIATVVFLLLPVCKKRKQESEETAN